MTVRFFDVDWTPVKEELHAKLLLPILGDQYGHVLERGELTLVFKDGGLGLRYFEHELPINPRQSPRVYHQAVGALTEALGADSPQLQEYLSIISQLENLPPYTDSKPERMAIRQREKEVARGRMALALSPLVTVCPGLFQADGFRAGHHGRRAAGRHSCGDRGDGPLACSATASSIC